MNRRGRGNNINGIGDISGGSGSSGSGSGSGSGGGSSPITGGRVLGSNNVPTTQSRREYDVGDVHVVSTTRTTPGSITQSTQRTTRGGGVIGYTTSVTRTTVGGGTPPVVPQTFINRPSSFLDSNAASYFDHPALNPYYRTPNGSLSSRDGQRRVYDKDIIVQDEEEEENEEEEEEVEQQQYQNSSRRQSNSSLMDLGIDDDMDEEAQIREAIRRSTEQSSPLNNSGGLNRSSESVHSNASSSSSSSRNQNKANSSFDEDDVELQKALNESMKDYRQIQQRSSSTSSLQNTPKNVSARRNNNTRPSPPPSHNSSPNLGNLSSYQLKQQSLLQKKRVKVRQDLNEYFGDDQRGHGSNPQPRPGGGSHLGGGGGNSNRNNNNNNNNVVHIEDDDIEDYEQQDRVNDHALEAMYNDPEMRGYLSPNEQKRLQRKREITESRRIREEQEREFKESLRKDELKREEEEEKKALEDAIQLSIQLERQGRIAEQNKRIEEKVSRLPPDPSTMTPDQLKGHEKEICEISIGLPPDGKRITRKFLTSNTIQSIRDWVDIYVHNHFKSEQQPNESEQQSDSTTSTSTTTTSSSSTTTPEEPEKEVRFISEDYQLLTTYPKQVLSDTSKTIFDLQLYPRCLLQLNNP